MPAGELVDVDTSPFSETKVTREMDFPKKYKAVGPNDLSPFLLKDGGEVLTSKVSKLLRLVWEREEIPKG